MRRLIRKMIALVAAVVMIFALAGAVPASASAGGFSYRVNKKVVLPNTIKKNLGFSVSVR